MSPSCGEPLKELMSKTLGRERSNYLQWKLVLIVQAAYPFNTSKLGRYTSSSETRLVTREEILGDGTDIHHGSSEESNQEL